MSKLTVEVKDNGIFIDGKKYGLLSGEVHYWRIPKEAWSKVLDRVVDLGLKFVSTYVPWNYHEIRQGVYDFNGRTSPQRDLEGFLELCERKSLYVLIRPGPYIYSEMPWAGVPEYAARYHRMHPKFLEYAEKWINAVSKVIIRHQYDNGCIVLLQVDNEIDPWEWAYGWQLGLYGGNGVFQKYLKKKYGDVNSLNRAWNTSFKNFSEVKAFQRLPQCYSLTNVRRYVDFCEFREWYCLKLASILAEMYRRNGVEIPIYFNAYPWGYPQNFYQFKEICDLIGIDIYPRNMVPEEDLVRFSVIVRYLKATAGIAWSAEFECGVWHDWHYGAGVLEAGHYRYMALLGLAFGLIGWNWYMLVNRDNWYFSPINEWGRVRPELYPVFKEIVNLYNRLDPTDLTRLSDVSIVVTREHIWGIRSRWFDDLLRDIHRHGLDFNVYEPKVDRDRGGLMIYLGLDYLNDEYRRRMLRCVEEGSVLAVFGMYPSVNEHGVKSRIDEDLHVDLLSIRGGGRFKITINGHELTLKTDELYVFSGTVGEIVASELYDARSEEDRVYAELVNGRKYVVGYFKRKGKGGVLLLGVKPSSNFITKLLGAFGFSTYIRPRIEGIITSVYKGDDRYVFFLVNTRNNDVVVPLDIDVESLGLNEGELGRDLRSGREFRVEKRVYVPVSKKDGAVVEVRL